MVQFSDSPEYRQAMQDVVEVIHVHSPALAAATRVMVRTLGRNRPVVIYTEHNRWPRYHLLTRWMNRLTYGLDDDHVAVSDDGRETVSPRYRGSGAVVVPGHARGRRTGGMVSKGPVGHDVQLQPSRDGLGPGRGGSPGALGTLGAGGQQRGKDGVKVGQRPSALTSSGELSM